MTLFARSSDIMSSDSRKTWDINERADKILTQELGFSKVSARWVPRLLTPEQKHTRCTVSKGNLELFEADEDNFLARFITVDETWVHHYQP